jgi:hypothetical protein
MCQTSYVVAGTFLPGRHLLFFLLQAPLLLLERHVLKWPTASSTTAAAVLGSTGDAQVAGSQPEVPPSRVIARWQGVQRSVVTFAVLLALAEWLFWPPLEACKSDVNGVAEIADGLAWVQQALVQGWRV